jgi:ribosomal protein L13E
MIGDGPGAWAKRRKEIAEMGQEDIKPKIERIEVAMTERVKSAARRGQGFSVGKLPLVMMVLNLVGRQSRLV